LTWEVQRRNWSMSRVVGAKLFELTSYRSRMVRYIALAIRTIQVIKNERPNIVFAQNPSIVLSLLVLLTCRLGSHRVVIDEHNSGIFPFEGKSGFLNIVARFIVRKADLVIVTNQALADYCQRLGGKAVIYPDPLPRLEPLDEQDSQSLEDRPLTLIFVCTWAEDEPYNEVIEAARSLDPKHFQILITGKYQGKIEFAEIPESVRLTGFISEPEYVDTFRKSDGAIILTKRDNCMNCGAYEAVALEVSGILSNTSVLKEYFGDAFIYTQNNASSIYSAIKEFSERLNELREYLLRKKKQILAEERDRNRYLEEVIKNEL